MLKVCKDVWSATRPGYQSEAELRKMARDKETDAMRCVRASDGPHHASARMAQKMRKEAAQYLKRADNHPVGEVRVPHPWDTTQVAYDVQLTGGHHRRLIGLLGGRRRPQTFVHQPPPVLLQPFRPWPGHP